LLLLINSADWVGISIINVIEFLSFSALTQNDKELFNEFISRIEVVDLDYDDEELIAQILLIRKSRSVKLPDAVVIASALVNGAMVVTNDAHMHKVLAGNDEVSVRAF
jgi:tRNA(fMet)-specific endonuclease VapC